MAIQSPRKLAVCVNRALRPIICSGIAALGLHHGQALAQETTDAEEVVITGSRIRTNGMESPSPVTVVTLEEIELINPASLIDGLAQLPQFNGSYTTDNFGFNFFQSPGSGTLSLRGLQGKRTLTLLDGKRVVGSSIFGGPDANLFPTGLMQTVESVTGGATAAYGTDAVAGAVNFILNKDYEGFKASVRGGMNQDGEFRNYGYNVAGGFALTERSHFLFSAESSGQDMVIGRDKAKWSTARYIDNPDPNAGESQDNPLLIPAPEIVSKNESLDGVIFFPNLIGNANTNRREAFIDQYGNDRFILDENGNATVFQDGAFGDSDANSLVGGGSGTYNDYFSTVHQPENERHSFFTYLDYDVFDNLNVHFEAMYAKVDNFTKTTAGTNLSSASSQSVQFDGITQRQYAPLIFSGNPFIPDNIQQIMDEEGFPYLTIGKVAHPLDFDRGFNQQLTDTLSLNVGFDYELDYGGFFDGWLLKGYYQSGKSDSEFIQGGALRQDRAYLAFDAVEDPDNPGNIICNVTQYLDDPRNAGAEGCVPVNPFGRGQASEEAIDWMVGYEPGVPYAVDGYFINEFGEYDPIYYEYISGEHKKRVIDLYLDNWELSADGVIWEDGIGAGPISMAIGYASRKERYQQVVQAPGVNPANDPNIDPPSGTNNAAIGRRGISSQLFTSFQDLFFSNVPFGKGKYKVDEAFVEFLVPALKDLPYVQSLDIGLAGRWADYESVAEVTSWKFSYTWRVDDDLRFRGTVSRDVRAPTMAERYDRTGGAAFFVRDYGIKEDCAFFEAGCFQTQVLQSSFGSVDLKPENAKTITVGLVYQPEWFDGFQLSMDWYLINIKDNINQLGTTGVIEGCHIDGIESLCDLIVRDGPPSELNPEINMISFLYNPYINQDYSVARGVDYELSYRTDVNLLGGGESVSVRFLGSYLREQIYNTNGVETDWVNRFWAPWTWNLSANYNRGPLSASLQTRWAGKLPASTTRNTYDEDLGRIEWDVADNRAESPMTVDGRIGYMFNLQGGSTLNVGLNINNIFDKSPRLNWDSSDGLRGDLRGRRFSLSLNYTY